MATDVFAELRRAAAKARRAVLAQWPAGTAVVWMDTVKRSRRLTGEIVGVRHGAQTAAVSLYAKVVAEEYTGKDRCLYSAVGSVVEVKPDRLTKASVELPKPVEAPPLWADPCRTCA